MLRITNSIYTPRVCEYSLAQEIVNGRANNAVNVLRAQIHHQLFVIFNIIKFFFLKLDKYTCATYKNMTTRTYKYMNLSKLNIAKKTLVIHILGIVAYIFTYAARSNNIPKISAQN